MVTVLLLFLSSFWLDNPVEVVNNYTQEHFNSRFQEVLYVSVTEQRMYHIKGGLVKHSYPISTATKGVGNTAGSEQTPQGLHSVKEKHGDQTPLYGRMIGRVYYGQLAKILQDTSRSKTDDVTTRILWLSGEEEGLNKGGNVDSYQRYIYIHGTSEEGRIGIPSSHGCIRMLNKDILELYPQISLGTKVLILDK